MANISYSAVVLDEKSRQRLINRLKGEIPENWVIIAHHMTINLGQIDPNYEKYIGMPIQLNVNSIAKDDKVMAVGVTGFYSKNTHPHITIAINRQNGGKAMMSNNLTNWTPLKIQMVLRGVVTEVEFQ